VPCDLALATPVLTGRGIAGKGPPKEDSTMSTLDATYQQVEQDIWAWIDDFVTAKNEFYGFKFAPCPFAKQALSQKTVDVLVW
jgi:hypothetical protein